MGAIEISGIGMAMIQQGVSFDAGAAMGAVLLSLLGVAAAAIFSSRARPGSAMTVRRPMPLSPASAFGR